MFKGKLAVRLFGVEIGIEMKFNVLIVRMPNNFGGRPLDCVGQS